MRKLSEIRDGWQAVEAEGLRLLREMTMEESLAIYAKLQRAWEPQLRATEGEFRGARLNHLAELQRRLARLDQWKAQTMDELYASVTRLQRRLTAAGVPSAISSSPFT